MASKLYKAISLKEERHFEKIYYMSEESRTFELGAGVPKSVVVLNECLRHGSAAVRNLID